MSTPTAIPFPALITALSDATRWRILAAIVEVGPLQIVEFSQRLKIPATNISKHITVLRRAGIVTADRPNLYGIRAEYLIPGQRAINLGPCILQLDHPSIA